MYLKTEVTCPGCQTREKILKFKAPSLLEASIVKIRCSVCESELVIRFTRPKGKENRERLASQIRLVPSPQLIEMRNEELKDLQS